MKFESVWIWGWEEEMGQNKIVGERGKALFFLKMWCFVLFPCRDNSEEVQNVEHMLIQCSVETFLASWLHFLLFTASKCHPLKWEQGTRSCAGSGFKEKTEAER